MHFYTTAGCWYYLEYPEQKQTAGCNINFDADGNYLNTMDAGWIEQAIVEAAKAQGMGTPRYIKPKRGAGFSDED